MKRGIGQRGGYCGEKGSVSMDWDLRKKRKEGTPFKQGLSGQRSYLHIKYILLFFPSIYSPRIHLTQMARSKMDGQNGKAVKPTKYPNRRTRNHRTENGSQKELLILI
jgi:hypothetical protein